MTVPKCHDGGGFSLGNWPVLTRARHCTTADAKAVLDLIRLAFAGMEGRIDPPSSAHRLTEKAVGEQIRNQEVWAIGDTPCACMFLTKKPGLLYLGKLAVHPNHQRKGLARRLIETAQERARTKNLSALQLETRIELTENHRFFRAMGFCQTGEKAHKGFARPTSLTFTKKIKDLS